MSVPDLSVLDKLRSLSAAEEFFACLEVPYEPAVVNVARLHILRRMGQYLAGARFEGLEDAEIRAKCRDFLSQAYEDFVKSSPIEQRVFKVLKDAVTPKEKPLIQLSVVSPPGQQASGQPI